MNINIKNIRDLKPFKDSLNALKLFSDDRLTLIHITLSVGEQIELHKNAVDVVFYVLDGKGELQVENETFSVEKGSCVEVKKDLDRAWRNNSTFPLCLLAIKKL